jgi:dihydroneopterin aldolase/2-amino-4-hydroxy-6-hydroxymethyldihydropteridine diphosphokinase
MLNQPVVSADGQLLDCIHLQGITVQAKHGVLAEERDNAQEFSADVTLYLDTQPAAELDALTATVDYAAVAEAVHFALTGQAVNLIETLAEKVAATVLTFPGVQAVDVVLHKPQAPVGVTCNDITVSIRRDLKARLPVGFTGVETAEEFGSEFWAVEPETESEVVVVPTPPVAPVLETAADHNESIIISDWPAPELPEPEPSTPEFCDDPLERTPDQPVLALLGLGSNMGDSKEMLRGAVAALGELEGVELLAVAPLARTKPVGGPQGQDDYLNTVVRIATTLSPRQLLAAAHLLEQDYDRNRAELWGPRTLDIDIITYGELIESAEDLTLPHPRAAERAFVLLPWSQMEPAAVLHGLGGGPVAALAATAPDLPGVRQMALDWLDGPAIRPNAVPVSAARDAADSVVAVPVAAMAPVVLTDSESAAESETHDGYDEYDGYDDGKADDELAEEDPRPKEPEVVATEVATELDNWAPPAPQAEAHNLPTFTGILKGVATHNPVSSNHGSQTEFHGPASRPGAPHPFSPAGFTAQMAARAGRIPLLSTEAPPETSGIGPLVDDLSNSIDLSTLRLAEEPEESETPPQVITSPSPDSPLVPKITWAPVHSE